MRGAVLIGPSSRVRLLCGLLLACFLLLAARAAHLTVVDSRAKGWGDRQLRAVLQLPAPRGMILDRREIELAVTLQAPSVYVIPTDVEDRAATTAALAEALGLDGRALEAELAKRRRFTFVKRWASRSEAARVRALGLPGVGILNEPRRAYPAGALAGQLIGFPNIDGHGVRGIEQQEDETLSGEPQTVHVQRVAGRRVLADDSELPQTAGGDVRLTIDAALQAEAEGALARAIERTGARGGIVVTLDPHNGDVLSLAEAPAVDPNFFRETDFGSTRSRAFLDALEPGSTMKAFLVAGALDAGVVRSDDTLDTGPGWLRVPGKTIRDRHPYGEISVAEVLQVSSNVGAVMVSQLLDAERHADVLRRFGFGRKTGADFPQESAGILRNPREWKAVDQATIAFGQGISVTPVQLAAATAALANRGVWQRPRLIAARRPPGGSWEETPLEAGRRAISEQAAATTLAMMETVVSGSGTGRRAALRGLRVAGKTGTAQKFDREAGRYSNSAYLAWFIGIVPADDPELVIAVLLDEPQGRAHGGGDAAAPVFAEVASSQLAHLGIATAPSPLRPEQFRTLLARAEEEAARKAEGARQQDLKVAAAGVGASTAKRRAVKPASRSAAALPKPAPAVAAPPAVAAAPPASASAEPVESHFVPDLRGETWQAAQRIAAEDSFVLELEGDKRGLAVEQHPNPGTVVLGKRPRIRLRFMQDREEG